MVSRKPSSTAWGQFANISQMKVRYNANLKRIHIASCIDYTCNAAMGLKSNYKTKYKSIEASLKLKFDSDIEDEKG